MTWLLWGGCLFIYWAGMVFFNRTRQYLSRYVWGAFGLTFLGVTLFSLMKWDLALQNSEAYQLERIFSLAGYPFQVFEQSILLIPDSTGWTGLGVSIECSALIESFALCGLILFYPRLSLRERITRSVIGLCLTYLLNLIRLAIIVMLIMAWGKPIVIVAHTIVARLVFFLGMVWLFWQLLTIPTLRIIRRDIEVSGRAAK